MKKFKNFTEMSMSVTLKPKKNNMYKVTKVGDKMKAHGGIKKGEKFHDSDIDGMHDSGIKVKYAKPKPMKKEERMYEVKMPEDGKAYMVKNCGCLKDPCDEYGSIKEQIKKGEAKMKPVNEYNTSVKEVPMKAKFKVGKAKPIPGNAAYKGPQNPAPKIKLNKTPGNMKNEAIQRRMDRKTIVATDPATGKKVIKVAPKKEIDIGKGKQESFEVQEAKKKNGLWANIHAKRARGEKMNPKGHKDAPTPEEMKKAQESVEVNEISDKIKMSYIKKANKKISDTEHMRDYQNKSMDKMGSISKDDKAFVNKKYDKDTLNRRKGVAMAKSKLGEQEMTDQMKINELKISTMQKYKRAAKSDIQTGENARHKGYPEKEIDQRQGKRDKGLDSARRQIAKKQVKMAKGVAFDKRYKGGNMTGASNAINKIKPGLADHPKVSAALKRANEEFNKGE